MNLFFSFVPYYFLSNFHCFGMCGPIAALIGRHPNWPLYLVGRMMGFCLMCTMAAFLGEMIAWEMGSFRAIFSILVGFLMIAWCLIHIRFVKWGNTIQSFFVKQFAKKTFWTPAIVGLATPLLPCGQSMIVFAFCAYLGDPIAGFAQGFLFSLLTTPSLLLAIKGLHRLTKFKRIADPLLKISLGFVGLLVVLRGFADLDVISHYTLIDKIHLTLW